MFGLKLKQLRLDRGLTQRQLAKGIGVTVRTIQNYEQGAAMPKDRAVIHRLAAYLEVPVDELVEGQDYYELAGHEIKAAKEPDDSEELFRLLQELTALFAGGSLSRGDRNLFLRAVLDLYEEAGPNGRKGDRHD